MPMVKNILLVLLLAVACFLGYAAFQPDTFEVKRSLRVGAPPEVVYEQLADFHNWRHWSPWDELDPDMTRTYEGAEKGEGAVYTWKGKQAVGSGRMEITEATPGEAVVIDLRFEEPYASDNTTRFDLSPTDDGTEVTWSMKGEKGGFAGKVMSVFMDFDAMIGKSFDKGLGKLAVHSKAEAKKRAEPAPTAEEPAGEGRKDEEGEKPTTMEEDDAPEPGAPKKKAG